MREDLPFSEGFPPQTRLSKETGIWHVLEMAQHWHRPSALVSRYLQGDSPILLLLELIIYLDFVIAAFVALCLLLS